MVDIIYIFIGVTFGFMLSIYILRAKPKFGLHREPCFKGKKGEREQRLVWSKNTFTLRYRSLNNLLEIKRWGNTFFFFSSFFSHFNHITTMTTAYRRSAKVVTDSEDDQSDSRQRRDLHITSKHAANDENKGKVAAASFGPYHTIPIHTITKPSVLSKEAPPENYSGFIRLGSKCFEAK